MQLLDRQLCDTRGIEQVADERFRIEQAGYAVRHPPRLVEYRAVGCGEHELEFMADLGCESRVGEALFDRNQQSACAIRTSSAVLEKVVGGSPCEPVAEISDAIDIEAHPLVTDRTDLVGEGDVPVDAERVPHGRDAQAGAVKDIDSFQRDDLGQRESGRVDDGPDDRSHTRCRQRVPSVVDYRSVDCRGLAHAIIMHARIGDGHVLSESLCLPVRVMDRTSPPCAVADLAFHETILGLPKGGMPASVHSL